MRRFTPLPENKSYTCRECFRTKSGNYFISPTLCKKCAAQRRSTVPTYATELPGGLTVTNTVEKRLRNQAEEALYWSHPRFTVPYTLLDKIVLYDRWPAVFIVFMPLGVVVLLGLLLSVVSGFVASALLLALFATGIAVYRLGLSNRCRREREPLRGWHESVDSRVLELAQQRNVRIQEREAFYSSSEWRIRREQKIRIQGRICQQCLEYISDDYDLTVDHIIPRSSNPELALSLGNLQVLCRSCNSKKGDR